MLKRVRALLLFLVLCTPIGVAATTVDFEDVGANLPIGSDFFYDGSSETPGPTDFVSGGATFHNQFDDFGGGCCWSGFAYSQTTDTTTPGFTNQMSAYPGGGAGGSDTYAVGFTGGGVSSLESGTDVLLSDAFVTNPTYAALLDADGMLSPRSSAEHPSRPDSSAGAHRVYGPAPRPLVDLIWPTTASPTRSRLRARRVAVRGSLGARGPCAASSSRWSQRCGPSSSHAGLLRLDASATLSFPERPGPSRPRLAALRGRRLALRSGPADLRFGWPTSRTRRARCSRHLSGRARAQRARRAAADRGRRWRERGSSRPSVTLCAARTGSVPRSSPARERPSQKSSRRSRAGGVHRHV